MEKLGIVETVEGWKLIRELRSAVNHEYEEDAERLSAFFLEMRQATPELLEYFQRLISFCARAYGVTPE